MSLFWLVANNEMKSSVGQKVIGIGGVTFKRQLQKFKWVERALLFTMYHLLQDSLTLLDAIGLSHQSTKYRVDDIYYASRGTKFENNLEARVAASFGKELPPIFDNVESSALSVTSTPIHPLPLMKMYESFNSPSTHSGIKQQILGELNSRVVLI